MMNKVWTGLVVAIASCSTISSAQAFPGMTKAEVTRWSSQNYAAQADVGLVKVPPLQTTQKYEPDQSDLDVSFKTMDGTVHLTVFLDPARKVKMENIDYRPACYWEEKSGCSSSIEFGQGKQGKGAKLIQSIWGQTVLADFQAATLTKSHTDGDTYRWYQGRLYNYETFQGKVNTTVQFSVVSKDVTQRDRIQRFMEGQRLPQ